VIADRTVCSSVISYKLIKPRPHWRLVAVSDYSRTELFCVISTLALFIVITAPRRMNKNVNTGAVIRGKRDTEQVVHKLLANYQTHCLYYERLEWKNRIATFRL